MIDYIKSLERDMENNNVMISDVLSRGKKQSVKYRKLMQKKKELSIKIYKFNNPRKFMNKSQSRIYKHFIDKGFSKEECLKKANVLSTK